MSLRSASCSLPAVSSPCLFLTSPRSLRVLLMLIWCDERRWTYTSTLSYIVDANTGRSSTAVATNSAFRGVSAFVATEIAVPLQVGSLFSLFCWLLNGYAVCLGWSRRWYATSLSLEKYRSACFDQAGCTRSGLA